MKNQSLASQFRRTFVRILTASAIGTVLTYAIVFYLFTKSLDRDIILQIITSVRFPVLRLIFVKQTWICCRSPKKPA